MGRLDRFLHRAHKVSKFKPLVNLAVSRLAVLKIQRQGRYSQARQDVVQLLQLGHHERALLRVEQVIKEQNMLDAYAMMESYCNLLMERADLIEQEKECPEELKEAVSSLIYAASRCGDFPELQEMRAVLASHYGKEFAARAVELRNHCAVSLRMATKLSTRAPSLDSKIKVLKELAAENNISLQIEENTPSSSEGPCFDKKTGIGEGWQSTPEGGNEEIPCDSTQMSKKYKDVADAAQAAFESAAQAAAAARAAVELSRSESQDPDNQGSPSGQKTKSIDKSESMDSGKPQAGVLDNEQLAPSTPSGMNAGDLERSTSYSSMKEIDATSSRDLSHTEVIFDESQNEESSDEGLPNQDDGQMDGHLTDDDKIEATPRLLSQKQIRSRFQLGKETQADPGLTMAHVAETSSMQDAKLNLRGRPFSVRTRQVRGY